MADLIQAAPIKTGGLKYDTGKAPAYSGCLEYFGRALIAVSDISDYGYQKYKTWGGWRGVPDGRVRYTNALARHLLLESVNPVDDESGKRHDAMVAWNSLARLELRIMTDEAEIVRAVDAMA